MLGNPYDKRVTGIYAYQSIPLAYQSIPPKGLKAAINLAFDFSVTVPKYPTLNDLFLCFIHKKTGFFRC